MSLVVENVFLEIAHQRSLLRQFGLAQHLLVEIYLVLIFEVSVILGEDRSRQEFLDVEYWVDHALTIALEGHVETAVAHCFEPGADRHDALCDVEANLAPLVDKPSADIFERLVEIPVQKLEGEPVGPCSLQ